MEFKIPAGERKLVIGYKQTNIGTSIVGGEAFGDKRYEVPYIFVQGRCYQLTAGRNEQVRNPKILANEARMDAFSARINKDKNYVITAADQAEQKEIIAEGMKLAQTEEGYATNVEIIDISGGKKKNSPSIIITVKPW